MLIAILGVASHVNGVSANKYPGVVLSLASMSRPKLNRTALQSGAPLNGLVSTAFPGMGILSMANSAFFVVFEL